MDSQIEEIKNKLNVLDIVGSYVKLTKTGVNYRGICPFHSEKGPSFFVSPARQMFKCFGCGVGGDIFEFVKRIEGVEFGDALRILAQKAGVQLKRENPQLRTERARLYEICELACAFFEKQLGNSALGREAKDYLLKRGISEESIKKWRLGYSPDTWQGLSDFIVGRGYKREEIVRAGLAVASEKGNNPYDRFRGRIIFPIFDANSQVIGFGARIFKELDKGGGAKYINTPQTMLYDKSNVLYGINFAKVPARKQNQCAIVEGYTDAIMCHQAGFENTVASSGTALTQGHLNMLKRYTENLLLAFDMDAAGDTATKRGINLAESQGFNIKVIDTYNKAKDPAEIILESPQNWQNSVAGARTIMDYYFDSAFSKFSPAEPEGKKEIGKMILPAIKRLSNKIEQSFWAQKLAQKLDVPESAVQDELKLVNKETYRGPTPVNSPGVGPLSTNRRKLLEGKVTALAAKDPENLSVIEENHYALFCDETKNVLENLKKDPNFASEMALRAEVEFEGEARQEVKLCLAELKNIQIRDRLNTITSQIKKAEQEKDAGRIHSLIEEFSKLSKEL